MNKEKQIEEMARDLCECYNSDGSCWQDDKPCDLRCDEYTNAQYLYDKGYRKASDVAEEIFAEIEQIFFDNEVVINITRYNELKKKYTEEGE